MRSFAGLVRCRRINRRTHRTLSGLWNGDTLLQRSHILEKSLNGEDKPENYFLLCPAMSRGHLRIRRTRSSFSRGSGIQRTHENYSMVLRRDMQKGWRRSLGVDQNLAGGAICRAAADPAGRGCVLFETIIVKNCADAWQLCLRALSPHDDPAKIGFWTRQEQKKSAAWRTDAA